MRGFKGRLAAASRLGDRHGGLFAEDRGPSVEAEGKGLIPPAEGGWRHFYSGWRFLAPIDGRGDGLLSTPDCDDGRPSAGAGMGLRKRRRRSVAAQGTAA